VGIPLHRSKGRTILKWNLKRLFLWVWYKFLWVQSTHQWWLPDHGARVPTVQPHASESLCVILLLGVAEPTGSMPPRLTQRSVTLLSAEQGADVHLSCAAQGNPPPTFTWVHISYVYAPHLKSTYSINLVTSYLLEAICRGFGSRWSHWIFQVT
jgi:hypothetical protein